MDVITISSSEDEENDPLQLDNSPVHIKEESSCQEANNSRPTVLQKVRPTSITEIVIVDIPEEEESPIRKRVKLTIVNGPSAYENVIKMEKPTNGYHITPSHKKIKTDTGVSKNIVDSAANVGEATSSEHNMENSESELLFRKFTDACKEAGDPGLEMDRIMKRAWHYYHLLNDGYKISKQFKRLLDKNIERVASDTSSMYSYMLEVITEMKSRKTTPPPSSGEPEAKRSRIANGSSKGASTSRDDQPSTSRDGEPSTSRDGQPLTSRHDQPSTSREGQPSTSRDGQPSTSLGSQDATTSNNSQENDGDDSDSDGENEEDVKKRRLIKKLNRQLASCSKHIQKLETAEVDWEDDGESTYIALQAWRDRAVKIYKKICEYTGDRDKSSYRIHLNNLDSTSRFPEVDRCIRKFVNNTREFPDFQDVLKIYNEYNLRETLNLTPIQVHGYAADMFQIIGNELQRKRKLDNWDLHCEYLQDAPDPADDDSELTNQLQHNRKMFISKVNQIVDEFALKQKQQKLEPVEVTEEDANKSEGDNSDPEEETDGALLIQEDSMDKLSGSETDNAGGNTTNIDHTADTETPELDSITTAIGLKRVELPSTTEPVTSPTRTSTENRPVTTDTREEENTSVGVPCLGLENRLSNQDASLAAVFTTSSDVVSAQHARKDVDIQVCVT